jgi:hypothetical protein
MAIRPNGSKMVGLFEDPFLKEAFSEGASSKTSLPMIISCQLRGIRFRSRRHETPGNRCSRSLEWLKDDRTGLLSPVRFKSPSYKRLQDAADARRRARRRPFVLQVPDNKADAVPFERLR